MLQFLKLYHNSLNTSSSTFSTFWTFWRHSEAKFFNILELFLELLEPGHWIHQKFSFGNGRN
jgi:hypothetical protein